MIPLAEDLIPPPTEWHARQIRRAKEALDAADPADELQMFLLRNVYNTIRVEGNQRMIAGVEIARPHLRPGEALLLAEDMRGLAILGAAGEHPDGRRWVHGASGRCREAEIAAPAGAGRWRLLDGFYLEAR